MASGATKVFVVTPAGGNEVVAYYAWTMAQIEFVDAPKRLVKGAGRYPQPVALLARLGVHENHQGKGLGAGILQDVLRRVAAISDEIGCRGLLVHAESDHAREFYRHLIPEFEQSPTDDLHLVLLGIDGDVEVDHPPPVLAPEDQQVGEPQARLAHEARHEGQRARGFRWRRLEHRRLVDPDEEGVEDEDQRDRGRKQERRRIAHVVVEPDARRRPDCPGQGGHQQPDRLGLAHVALPDVAHDEERQPDLHVGYFRGLSDAPLIRDAIRDRLRRHADAGLGDPDDRLHESVPAPAVTAPTSPDLAAAAAMLRDEARALRAALSDL